jgi:proteasome accessory factor B
LHQIVADAVAEAPTGGQAKVWVADGRVTALRRAGRSAGPRQQGGRAGEVIELDIGFADRLAREITGYGADAIVLEPASLRDDVLARLRGAAAESRT